MESKMSVSLWAYDPIRCKDAVCCGDCDECLLDEMEIPEEIIDAIEEAEIREERIENNAER